MKVQGRTFVVSGGSSGLGLATVEDLLAGGANVAIVDRSPPSDAFKGSDTTRWKYFNTDISSLQDITAAVNGIASWAAESKAALAGVVNCAGIATAAKMIGAHGEPHSADLWASAIAVNLTGAFNLTRLLLQHLVKGEPEPTEDGERGVVIFVASAAAFEGQPGQTAYAATKGALRSMTLPMARDLARHAIRVVAIAPGVFESAMTARMPEKTRRSLSGDGLVYPRRFGAPQEFARTVRWILECPYVNGETIRLSGAGRLPAKL